MYEPKIEILNSTPEPARLCALVARQATMANPVLKHANCGLLEYCYTAKHRSVFEHASLTARITGVSRAFMAQITRHRHVSFMCSSQHYQDYRDYPIIVPDLTDFEEGFNLAVARSTSLYGVMVDNGVEKPEARMILPEATAVNLIMTANAREWAHIMNLRLCKRNVREMRVWAGDMMMELRQWFPELFIHVGPDCVETQCTQGPMKCGK